MSRSEEFEAADELLVALEEYYDDSDQTLEPIVPGHRIHLAVGEWRKFLPRRALDPSFSKIWKELRNESKKCRDRWTDAAENFADLLKEHYPALAEAWTEDGGWFPAPPSESSRFRFGPVSGQIRDLVKWMQHGEPRTLKKHNGRGSYFITQEHKRLYHVWFAAKSQHDVVSKACGESA